MQYIPTLRLYFDGGVRNDYRVKENNVEFRTSGGGWRVLDDSDVRLHFRFDTKVSRWIRRFQIQANPPHTGSM